MMPYTEIYFKSWCPYCQRALALLETKNIIFDAIDLTNDAQELELQMYERSGRSSVPQIFIEGRHIGGYDDMAALDASGELDILLSGDEVQQAA